jgi:hypothetical protein
VHLFPVPTGDSTQKIQRFPRKPLQPPDAHERSALVAEPLYLPCTVLRS